MWATASLFVRFSGPVSLINRASVSFSGPVFLINLANSIFYTNCRNALPSSRGFSKKKERILTDSFGILTDFVNGNLDVSRMNYGMIVLIPKGKDLDKIQKYRPIYLLNVTFKILTKVLVNRLTNVI